MAKYRYYISLMFILSALAVFSFSHVSYSPRSENAAQPAHEYNGQELTKASDYILPLKGVNEQLLRRKGYLASYNRYTKEPNWVAWHLTKEHLSGTVKRPGNGWHEDPQVPSPRATHADYKKSGWSRGHMCPAGDNKWDSDAMYDTFLYSNVCPQHPRLNSGDWNEIEIACRRWAQNFNDIYIICGPIYFRKEHQTIGANRIMVPDAFFKVVICLNGTPKGIGFICRNTKGNRRKDMYVNSISQVERITGMTFFPNLPSDISFMVKNGADIKSWDMP
jgi:endonuclease G